MNFAGKLIRTLDEEEEGGMQEEYSNQFDSITEAAVTIEKSLPEGAARASPKLSESVTLNGNLI